MSSSSLPNVDTVVKTANTYARDLTERVIWTFLGGTTAVITAAGPVDMLHASFWEAVGVGGLAAVVSFAKGLGARLVGAKNSASTASGV
ncbi:hypothetical protein [Streptomyces sp. NBC_00140]|uniref:hypothetical protein n=1 Tax=Streptomyces sp. NBC_00140 TaxID=2975664 RepID=UPI0022508193|nr:hypothetical protein [Streptomyces sp. NBC_00140]MCX5335487.1 hypothetical protein [Streptomyces sp. NBC_00140]MCX5338333.1 hypothetical protein [Streptomyces sp. NBC_00140]